MASVRILVGSTDFIEGLAGAARLVNPVSPDVELRLRRAMRLVDVVPPDFIFGLARAVRLVQVLATDVIDGLVGATKLDFHSVETGVAHGILKRVIKDVMLGEVFF
jgi:hypothetical protein